MMKRVFAVLLLVCIFCLALAGCGKTDLEKSEDYMQSHPLEEKKLYSISFCLVSDAAIDPVVLTGMQAEFNRYTEANYNIHVEFVNKTAAEYAAWLETKFTSVEAAYAVRTAAKAEMNEAKKVVEQLTDSSTDGERITANANYYALLAAYRVTIGKWTADVSAAVKGHTDAALAAVANGEIKGAKSELNAALEVITANSTSTGSIGSDIREVYPEITEDQFDIIYIENYEMLFSLVRAGRLRELTDDLNSKDYRLIKKQMTEKFFEGARIDGRIFAVPNCRVLADYKYLRVNVEKANYYNYRFQKEITDYSSTSMLRQAIDNEGSNSDDYVQRNLAGNYNYRNELAEDGAWWVYASVNEQLPQINQSDLMNGMFAITSYTYVDDGGTVLTTDDDYYPAVKILYALNSEPALHTVLQYGAPGMTYSLKTVVGANGEKQTIVEKIDGGYTYNVDVKYTGNIFSLYPTEEEYNNGTQKGNQTQTTETVITRNVFGMKATSSTEGCTAGPDVPFGKTGETVTFTATPAEGYRFVQWYLKGVDGDPDDIRSTDAVYHHVVAKGDGDLDLLALFEPIAEEE